jgi:hypothetical protein
MLSRNCCALTRYHLKRTVQLQKFNAELTGYYILLPEANEQGAEQFSSADKPISAGAKWIKLRAAAIGTGAMRISL